MVRERIFVLLIARLSFLLLILIRLICAVRTVVDCRTATLEQPRSCLCQLWMHLLHGYLQFCGRESPFILHIRSCQMNGLTED